eukprot:scaffold3.g6729.t1
MDVSASTAFAETLGQSIVPAINKLQDIFSQVGLGFRVSQDVKLDLPQIAVVGSQSSGKSSVLEALVGRDFLPRGCNIVTRRPLILQLVKTAPASGQYAEWGEFLHLQGKRFYDFERIRQEILAETERVVGANKGVSDKPIRLKVFSPNILTMTLVDLPGITRVPVGGQPSDIEARVRRMILEYVRAPSCVILAVTPANQDIAASDALDLARQVDPEGFRTVGVLTKLDIMDRGTDAVAVLRNEVVPLRLGYIGCVLRSQEDIINRRGMGDARLAERAFFESRPEYLEVASQCGVGHLARSLNQILVDHIRTMLPSLRGRMEDAIAGRQAELRLYGEAPPGNSPAARGGALLALLDAYSTNFSAMLDGRSDHLPISELAGGARIRHIFHDIFTAGLDSLDPTSELSDEGVRTAIKNSGGIRGSLLIPEAPFELLVRRAIERLQAPALQCKEFVHGELLRVAAQCTPPDVARFPVLQSVLAEAVEEFISQGASPAESMIRNLVQCELAYINTSNPQFIGGNRAIAQVLERRGASGAGGGGNGEEAGGRDSSPPKARAAPAAVAAAAALPPGRRSSGGLASAARAALRGVEPELFNPEDLLAATGGLGSDSAPASANSSPPVAPRPGLAALNAPSDGAKGSWFAQWFGPKGPDGGAPGAADAAAGSLARPPRTLRVPKAVSDQEGVQVEVTRLLVESYFDIDAVPKVLMHFLVNSVQRGMQAHLIRKLYREDMFAELMAEREDIASKRLQCQEALRALRSGLATLEGLPAELLGRVNASGKWSFRQMLEAEERAAAAGARAGGGPLALPGPLGTGMANGDGGGSGRGGAAQQLSASTKAATAAMSAVTLLGGGIPAFKGSPRKG